MPADGGPPPLGQVPADEEPDEPQTLLQLLTEHLSLAFLSRAHADTNGRERREWDRLIVAYLALLAQWLWEDPKAVREFLEAGGLSMVRLSFVSVFPASVLLTRVPRTAAR